VDNTLTIRAGALVQS